MVTVADVTSWLEQAYPPRLAESWDRVGLACGDPDAEVTDVLFAVDVTDAVVDQARELGAQLLITHHPLLLRGIHAVRADEPKGRLVMRMLQAGIAQFAAHTNADAAVDGVSDALAAALALTGTIPLDRAAGEPWDKIVTFVPPESAEAVLSAWADAGAGSLGNYDGCAFVAPGEGRFRPLPGADPFVGTVGEPTRTPELRLETVAPRRLRERVVAALVREHPYEEPAYDVIPLATPDSGAGLGRIGSLPAPLSAAEVARRLAEALPATAGGVRLGGDPERTVRRVAVMGGAGDSFLDAVRATDADLYVTSDLRHHPASEFLAWDGAPALIDISHWAAEWLWLPRADAVVRQRAESSGHQLATTVSRLVTDPWSARF